MNDPEQPTWGSGRAGQTRNQTTRTPLLLGHQEILAKAATARTRSPLGRHLQNDFKARLDWCVTDFSAANHPPPRIRVIAPCGRSE
jgi:hypothetical protein